MGKKRKKYIASTVRCTSCDRRRGSNDLELLKAWVCTHFHYDDSVDIVQFARDTYIKWVCDPCLKSGKALRANIQRERPDGGTYTVLCYVYVDIHQHCLACKSEFVFSQKEQRFWYEELDPPIKGGKSYCNACRKEVKAAQIKKKAANAEKAELGHLISNLDPTDVQQLEAIINIFVKWENVEKARFYLSFIPKIASFRNNEKLIAKHAQLKEMIQNN